MKPFDGLAEGARIEATTTLEAAAKTMTESGQTKATITDEAGTPIGTLDLQTMIAAMVTPAGSDASKMAAE